MIEVRYDADQKVDEIVASDCHVQFERMSAGAWCLIINTEQSRSHFDVLREGKLVETKVYEVDMAGGRPTPLQRALDYVLPFVHIDVRDKALQIASGAAQPSGE